MRRPRARRSRGSNRRLRRQSDQMSRRMVGRRTDQPVSDQIVMRMQLQLRRRPHREADGRWSLVQDLQHANRNQRTIPAIIALLLVGAARHIGRHVRHVRHLAHTGQRRSGRRGHSQRRNCQACRHEDGEQQSEQLANIHVATVSQRTGAEKVTLFTTAPAGDWVVNRSSRPGAPHGARPDEYFRGSYRFSSIRTSSAPVCEFIPGPVFGGRRSRSCQMGP